VVGAIGASLYFILAYKMYGFNHAPKKNKAGVSRLSNKTIIKSILKYAFPITIASALQNSGTIVDLKIVKSRLLSTGLSQKTVDIQWGYLGLYNTLMSIPMAIIGALAIALVPAISRIHALDNKKGLRFNIKSSYRVTFMIAIPCAVGLGVLSMPILRILGYDKEVSPLLIWGAWVLILYAITLVQTSILQGMGKVNVVTIFSVVGILAKVVVNYILIAMPSFGILGAIWGNAACYLVMLILFQWQINDSIDGRIHLIPCYIKPLIAGLAMGIVTFFSYKIFNGVLGLIFGGYILNLFASLISIALSAGAYGLVLVTIGGVKKSDLNSLPNKITKLIPRRIYKKLK